MQALSSNYFENALEIGGETKDGFVRSAIWPDKIKLHFCEGTKGSKTLPNMPRFQLPKPCQRVV